MICNSTCLRTPSDRKTNSKVLSTMSPDGIVTIGRSRNKFNKSVLEKYAWLGAFKPADVGIQDIGLRIAIILSLSALVNDGQARVSTDKTFSAQNAEFLTSNLGLAAATFGSVKCWSQSTMDSCLQRKTEVRVSRSNEEVILVGSRVLGRGPLVGMIASLVLDFKKV